jgi:hypothetical protein
VSDDEWTQSFSSQTCTDNQALGIHQVVAVWERCQECSNYRDHNEGEDWRKFFFSPMAGVAG